MATSSPITGVPLPVTGGTDQVAADLMTAFTAAEKMFIGTFASASARDSKITAPTAGMVAFLSSPGKFTYYDGTLAAWADMFNPTAWGTWTPTLQSTSGTAFNLGSGSSQIGRYSKSGKSITFQACWNFGSSVSGPGGALVFVLPVAAANIAGLQQTGQCSLYVPNTGDTWTGFWSIFPGESIARPHFPRGAAICSMTDFRDTSDGTTSGTGVPQVSGTSFDYPIQVNGTLVAYGSYQTA